MIFGIETIYCVKDIDIIKKVDKLESTNGIYIVNSDVYLVCDGDSFKLN